MSPAEMQFREVETKLDQKLSEFRHSAAASGLAIHDWSARTYNYKNEALSWSWQFVRDVDTDGETERVSVLLTYMEPYGERDELAILVRCEVFQKGQISRVDRKQEQRFSIQEIKDTSFELVLRNAFDRGRTLLCCP